MNRKNNFLISISEINDPTVHVSNPEMQNRYIFKSGNVNISINYSDDAVFAISKDEKLIILLSGYIYQDDQYENLSTGEYLLGKYNKLKKEFVKQLNGSFCLFFANKDSGEIYFATDRINSRKIFFYKNGNSTLFSTEIKDLPLKDCSISYAGLTSYLVNGSIHNDLTQFEEIKKLDRASLHKIAGKKIISEKYWDYIFTNEFENRNETDLTEELNQLYIQSLRRKIKGKKNIFISLSGGYDSRAIVAILKDKLKVNTGVTCFSYHSGEFIKDSDSDIAQQVSEKLGYNFKLLNLYNGNPFNVIRNNSELGNGLAFFSVELDAWNEINNDFTASDKSILLTGDMHEGGRISVQFHGNLRRALEKLTIYGSEFLKEFKSYLSSDMIRKMSESWNAEYNKILKKAAGFDEIVNLIDYIYIDQRIPNVICTARESFQMPFIETATPYFDNDVLDYYRKLPPRLRDFMTLHKMTISSKYPDIYKINISSEHWGKEPTWDKEIGAYSEVFIDDIKNHKSKLDNIIPPDKIISSITDLNGNSSNKNKSYLKRIHRSVNKILPSYHKYIEVLPGGKELTRIAGKYVNQRISHPMIKILIMRTFLSRI